MFRNVAPLGSCTVCGKPSPADEFSRGWRLLDSAHPRVLPVGSIACPACFPVGLRRAVRGVRVDGVRFDPVTQAWKKDPET